MSTVIEAVRIIALLVALLFGGMGLGIYLADILAPDSPIAMLVGVLMLPLCLGLGMTSRLGVASAAVRSRLRKAGLWAERGFAEAVGHGMDDPPGRALPGAHVFVPVSVTISIVGGILIALSPSSIGFFLVLAVTALAGLVYGVLLWWLAEAGLLPFPKQA
jgi:hypothetical protein